jgi:hypothetical protein
MPYQTIKQLLMLKSLISALLLFCRFFWLYEAPEIIHSSLFYISESIITLFFQNQ